MLCQIGYLLLPYIVNLVNLLFSSASVVLIYDYRDVLIVDLLIKYNYLINIISTKKSIILKIIYKYFYWTTPPCVFRKFNIYTKV